MRSRPLIPGGRSGLLILAICAVPLVLSKCKPLAKRLADKMDKWSEKLKEDAKAPEATEAKPEDAAEAKSDASTAAPKADRAEATKPKAEPKKAAPKAKTTAKPKAAPAAKPKKPKAGT